MITYSWSCISKIKEVPPRQRDLVSHLPVLQPRYVIKDPALIQADCTCLPLLYTSLIPCAHRFQRGGCEIYLRCSVFAIYVRFRWGHHINQMPRVFGSVNPEKKNKSLYPQRSYIEKSCRRTVVVRFSQQSVRVLKHPVSVQDWWWLMRTITDREIGRVVIGSCMLDLLLPSR